MRAQTATISIQGWRRIPVFTPRNELWCVGSGPYTRYCGLPANNPFNSCRPYLEGIADQDELGACYRSVR
jgi:hypothetical protein